MRKEKGKTKTAKESQQEMEVALKQSAGSSRRYFSVLKQQIPLVRDILDEGDITMRRHQ